MLDSQMTQISNKEMGWQFLATFLLPTPLQLSYVLLGNYHRPSANAPAIYFLEPTVNNRFIIGNRRLIEYSVIPKKQLLNIVPV